MSEFKIRVQTELNDQSGNKALDSLQKLADKKKLKINNIGFGDLSKFNSELANIQKAFNNAFKMNNDSLTNLKQVQSTLKEINQLSKESQKSLFGGSSSPKSLNQVSTLLNQYKQLKVESNTINKQLSKSSSSAEYKTLEQQLIKVNSQLHVVKSSMSDVERTSAKAFDDKLARNLERSYASTFSKIQSEASKLSTQLSNLGRSGYVDKSSLSNISSELQKIQSIDFKNLSSSDLQKTTSDLNKLKDKIKEVESSSKNLKFQDKLKIDTSKVQRDLDMLRKKCEETGRSSSSIDKLEQELRQLSSIPMDKVPNQLASIRSQVSGLKSSFTGLNSTTQQTSKFFNNLYQSFSTFGLSYLLVNQLQKGISGISSTVIDLDSSFRDLMKVAPDTFRGTAEELDNVKDKAIEAGISVARSSNDIIQGTAKSFQMGIQSIDDAMQYATKSAQFANVADLSIEDSDKYLASIMAAYGGVTESLKPLRENIKGASEDYNNLSKFTDLANYAGNKFSVTSGDVGISLQKSASALGSFGTSMEDSIALTVGMQEVVQNADKTGTSLKSIAVNLAGVKAAAKDGTIEANRTNKAFKEMANIDIWDKQTGEIKSTMNVLSELSSKWDTLNQDAKAGIAEATAGKLHINSFVALMDNWKQVVKYQEDYKQGLMVGSAEKENERFINSIEGKLVRLSEELKKLVTTTISTDMFKDMIDGAADFLSILNNIVSSFDKMGMSTPLVVGTLGTLFTSIKALGTKDGLSNGLIPIAGISKINQALKSQETQLVRSNGVTVNYTKGLSNLSKGVSVASGSVAKASGSYKKYSVSTSSASISAGKLSSTINKTNKGFMSTATSMVAANAKSMLLNTGITLLNGAMIGLAVAGVSMAIKAFDDYINKAEKAAEKHKENIEAIQGDISTYNSQKVAINEIAKEYDELSKKTDKSANDFRRLSELKDIIAETMPDLVIGYDASNDPILKMNGSAEDLIKSLDEAIGKKQALLADEQIANGYNALDLLQKKDNGAWANHQNDNILLDQTEGKINTVKQKVLSGLKSLNTESEKHYQKNLENYKKYMQDYKDAIIEENNVIRQASLEVEVDLATARQGAIASLNKDNNFTKLSENVKQFAYELTNSLDLSSLSKSDLSSYVSSLKRALNDGDVDNVFKKYQDLRLELEKTGQYENYEKAVSSIVPELAKTLGLSEDMVRSMVEVPPSMKVATDAVDAYLQTFGKRSQMASFDEETRNLIATYDAFNDLFLDLSNKAAYVEIDGVIQYDPKIVSSILDNPGMPQEIKGAIEAMKKDGLTQDEVELLLKISLGYQLGDTDEGNNLIDEAQKELDERLGNKTVDIGNIKVKANYEVESHNKEKLEAEIKEFAQFEGRDEVRKKLILEAVGVEDIQLYADIIKNLPTNSEYTDKFIIEMFGDIEQLEEYQQIIDYVKQNPEIAQKYNIDVENLDKFTESARRLNELEGKKVTTYVDSEGEEEVIDATNEIIENQNEIENKEVSVKVNKGEIQGTAEDIKALIEYSTKLEDGTYNISFKTDTKEAIDEIESFRQTINNLAKEFLGIPDITTEVDTEQSAKNISGLIKRIKEYLEASGKIKPITFIANTEQAAKNISGLIRRINEVPTGARALTYNVNTNYKTSGNPEPKMDIPQTQFFETVVKRSMIEEPNEIALLSDSPAREMVANTGVEQLNAKARAKNAIRAKNPISTMDSLNYDVNALKNLENQLKKISNELDFIAKKSENAFGKDKIKYLERQVVLYKQQQDIQHQLAESMRSQQADLKNYLSGKGVKFGTDGDVLNYATKMLAIEKEIERLNKANSDSKKGKNVDNSAAIDSLNQQKEALETYLDLTFNKIPDASEEWWNLYNSIEKAKDSIENIAIDRIDKKIEVASEEELVGLLNEKKKLLQELANKKKEYVELLKKQGASESQIEQATYEWKKQEQAISEVDDELEEIAKSAEKLANDISKAVRKATEDIMSVTQDIIKTQQDIINAQIDMIDKQMQLSKFDVTGSYEALKEKISLLEKEKKLQNDLNREIGKQKDYYKQVLSGMGIYFDSSGMANNVESVLDNIKNQMSNASSQDELDSLEEKFNDIVSTLKDYNSALKDINNNQNSLIDIQLEIENIYKEMINTTKKIEDRITDIISKQVEERKKLIDEETNKRLENLKKEQDAYNENRNKEDWEKENNTKLKELEELQSKIDAVSRDTSLEGQSKLQELLKEMAQKQDDYNSFLQDKLDKDINDMYDKESEKIQEDADKEKEELDKTLDKEELYKIIKEALSSGKLTNIDGSVTDLKDALLEYEDKYGDGLSILGGIIKKDILSQLDISYDTLKNIEEVLKALNIDDISRFVPDMKVQSMSDYGNVSVAKSNVVNFNESLITVHGSVTPDVLPELKSMIKEAERNITRNIMNTI